MKHTLALLALAAFAATPVALRAEAEPAAKAASAKLDIGSPAPEFKPAAWIKGEPVTAFEKGKTYLIECWATWCGPCVEQIPHVDGLRKKFEDKGLVVIGMNVWDGPRANVEKFVKAQGDKMGYRIAFDGKEDGRLAKDWLQAAGVNGIPHAFVVRDGKIIWHGHPGELEDSLVSDMVAGKFDPAKAAEAKKAAEARQAKLSATYEQTMKLLSQKKYDEALTKADELADLLPAEDKDKVQMLRADILLKKGDAEGALARLVAFAKAQPDSAGVQYTVARKLLSDPAFKDKRALALPYAKKADSLDKHPSLKLLVAQAEYAAGNKDAALGDLEQLAKSPDIDDAFKGSLTSAMSAVKAGKEWPADHDEEDGE